MEIGTVLYSIIDRIGRKKIQTDVTLDIGLSRRYMQFIISEYESRIGIIDEESVGLFCEALLHFMLTVCTLPSSRKGEIKNVCLDIVIPNLYTLKSFPERAIIIQIIKKIEFENRIQLNNIAQIQPYDNNIWIVSGKPVSVHCVNYLVRREGGTTHTVEKRDFSNIIWDAHQFLHKTGDKSFRFFNDH